MGLFLGLGLKLPNNSAQHKVSYYKTTELYVMSGGTKIDYEVNELRVCFLKKIQDTIRF